MLPKYYRTKLVYLIILMIELYENTVARKPYLIIKYALPADPPV